MASWPHSNAGKLSDFFAGPVSSITMTVGSPGEKNGKALPWQALVAIMLANGSLLVEVPSFSAYAAPSRNVTIEGQGVEFKGLDAASELAQELRGKMQDYGGIVSEVLAERQAGIREIGIGSPITIAVGNSDIFSLDRGEGRAPQLMQGFVVHVFDRERQELARENSDVTFSVSALGVAALVDGRWVTVIDPIRGINNDAVIDEIEKVRPDVAAYLRVGVFDMRQVGVAASDEMSVPDPVIVDFPRN